MLNKKIIAGIATTAAAAFILGSLGIMPALAQTSHDTNGTQATLQTVYDDDATEATVEGPDMDTVEEQVGDQIELDDDDAAEDADMDAVEEQQPQYSGSIPVDGSQYEDMSEAEEAAALQGKATISAADAEAAALAANAGASIIETELDNENGVLVYSVELSNGSEVKVDAGTGGILHTEFDDVDD